MRHKLRMPACRAAALLLPASLLLASCSPAGARPASAPAAAADSARPAPAERVLAEALRLLAGLRRTAYAHATRVEAGGEHVEADCSGLAILLLERAAPESLAAARRAAGRERLRAMDLRRVFAAAPDGPAGRPQPGGWLRVESLEDARPGDFLAWERIEDEVTGHVVLLAAHPVREAPGLYRAEVIDSTSTPHAADTRGKLGTGIGRGTMWFETDAAGRPAAWRWRAPDSPRFESPMAVGRPAATR